MLVAMLMFSSFRCSCLVLEDVLWIVPALPALGFCSDPRIRERLASRASRSNASSASEPSRPATPHEPVLPVAITPPRSSWRRGRPLQGMMPPPSPVPEIPLASRPSDPALHALRRSEQCGIQTEMAHVRAKREFLNSRSAGLDARESRIGMMYRTMFRERSTAFGILEAPQASEAMQAPPGLRSFAFHGQ